MSSAPKRSNPATPSPADPPNTPTRPGWSDPGHLGRPPRAFAVRDFLPHERDDVAPEVHGVVECVIATGGINVHAQLDVFHQGRCHGLLRTDECHRVPAARQFGRAGAEGLPVKLLFPGKGQQPL